MIYYDCETRQFSIIKSDIILYHYTNKDNISSIKKYGIKGKYALSEGSNSKQTGLPDEKLNGLVYLTKSKKLNAFKKYSARVTVKIPYDEYKLLNIVTDPYYDEIKKGVDSRLNLIMSKMKTDRLYYYYIRST